MLQEKTVSMPSGAGEAVGTFDTPYVVTASDIEQQAHLVGVLTEICFLMDRLP
jgi:hypothetical protein